MLSDKYIAGLLDSDGCISMGFNKQKTSPLCTANAILLFGESPNKSNIVTELHEILGGTLSNVERENSSFGKNPMRYLRFSGDKAVSTMQRLKQHVVVKRGLLEFVCALNKTKVMKDIAQKEMKLRRAKGQKYPNFPSRKWMAGYVDGNGSLTGAITPSGKFRPRLVVASWANDQGVLELMKKQFGGSVYMKQMHGTWQVYLQDPSKCEEVLGYLEHVKIMKPKRDYLLSLARNGGFQDGKAIRDQLKNFTSRAAETKSLSAGEQRSDSPSC